MDRGQFGAPRPNERRVINGAGSPPPAYRQPEKASSSVYQEQDGSPAPQQTARVSRQVESRPKNVREKSASRLILGVVIGAVVAVLGIASWFFATNTQTAAGTGIDTGKYQAVFFTNGQVYFGKLKAFNNEYMKLTDIYYLQTQSSDTTNTEENPQKTSSDSQTNIQLIKLGDEIHGPEDEMILAKDQMLFYENLKSDSKVVQSIKKYQASH